MSNDWVAQGPDGGWEVYKVGQLQGNFDSQQTAERMLNYLVEGTPMGDSTGGRQHTPAPAASANANPQGALPASMDPQMALLIANGNWDIQRLQLDYQYARMNLVDAVNAGVAKDAQKAQEKYQDALIALQTAQQDQKALQDQVSTQIDIWKTQGEMSSPNRNPGARYHSPAPNPALPADYYKQNGGLQTGGQPALAGGPLTPTGSGGAGGAPSPTPAQAAPPSNTDYSVFDSLDELGGKLNPEQQAIDEKQSAMIIRYRQAHPESTPGWAEFAKAHPDFTGDSGGWTGAPGTAAGSAGGSAKYFGGQWDSSRGREPGDDDAGSIQKLERETLQKIKELAQKGQEPDIWKKYLGGA
ncbi:MAG: hypothetical protein Q8P59_14770 [Dehalococcoidia bacterium]|nr:hypothetical protein [Dehalococcoidia bacterium]